MVNRSIPAIAAVVLLCLLWPAVAVAIEPAPTTYVADRANIIDAGTEQRLIGLLQELEQKTSARIIVLTVQTTGGQDIHQFAFERADAWTFGANHKSASVLVVVAAADKKYRFEVGYDWEAVLTDGFVGQVGRTYLVPHFRAGRSSQGVLEATAALAQKVAQDRRVALTGMPKLRPMGRPRSVCALGGFLPVIFLIVAVLLSRGRHRGAMFWGLLAGSMLGGRRGGGFGGGFGGGGFGGFGGGGGGGFGGGGASGGW